MIETIMSRQNVSTRHKYREILPSYPADKIIDGRTGFVCRISSLAASSVDERRTVDP